MATLAKEVIFLITERDAWTINGYLGIVILTVIIGVAALSLIYEEWVMSIIFFCAAFILGSGFTVIHPNESVIVQFGGSYAGSYRQAGMVLFIPFSKKIRISLRERIFKSDVMHVHDVKGKPVSMSIVLLFKVVDAAKAVYDVEDMEKYIAIQSEMSVRNLMTTYAHTDLVTEETSLQEMTHQLKQDLYKRLKRTGVALTEIRVIPALPLNENISKEPPTEWTEKLLQFIEKERLLPLNDESKKILKNKLTTSFQEK